jgi:uncharacterized protein (TIGR03084 family)
MTVYDDLAAEQERLESILASLDEAQWASPSGAEGWTVADVVLHLAQAEEMVAASVERRGLSAAPGMQAGNVERRDLGAAPGMQAGNTVEERAAGMVRAQRRDGAPAAAVFERWQRARPAALAALRGAGPDQPVQWVAGPVKPATLATTRLTEHWAHGLDITGPLGIDFPDTGRLRHVAWLAHRTLPYALSLGGEPPVVVRFELTAPDGSEVWRFGPGDAGSAISGPAGELCRVAVHRLDPASSALQADGPDGAVALRWLRTYAK